MIVVVTTVVAVVHDMSLYQHNELEQSATPRLSPTTPTPSPCLRRLPRTRLHPAPAPRCWQTSKHNLIHVYRDDVFLLATCTEDVNTLGVSD